MEEGKGGDMKLFYLWGGYSYSVGEPEAYASWSDAVSEYRKRYDWGVSSEGYKTPLWGDCAYDEYVITTEHEGLTLAEVLMDHDNCDAPCLVCF